MKLRIHNVTPFKVQKYQNFTHFKVKKDADPDTEPDPFRPEKIRPTKPGSTTLIKIVLRRH
jgi:hypothetical protein